jgi:hypothetical protein
VSQYGCFNRPEGKPTVIVQDGWLPTRLAAEGSVTGKREMTRLPRMIEIPDPMSRDCKHQLLTPNDPQCAGCRWQAPTQATDKQGK